MRDGSVLGLARSSAMAWYRMAGAEERKRRAGAAVRFGVVCGPTVQYDSQGWCGMQFNAAWGSGALFLLEILAFLLL